MKRAKQRKYRRTLTEIWQKVWGRHNSELNDIIIYSNPLLRRLMEDKK